MKNIQIYTLVAGFEVHLREAPALSKAQELSTKVRERIEALAQEDGMEETRIKEIRVYGSGYFTCEISSDTCENLCKALEAVDEEVGKWKKEH